MATITPSIVKQLRDLTGAGMLDCKKALEASNGDLEEAVVWLREQGIAKAGKRAGRATANGVVEAYLHRTGDYPPQTGSMIELNCESDFVAKGDEFRSLARELAMHIAAAAPRWVVREEVPAELVRQEREVALEQARNEGRPEAAWEKIVEGRLANFYKESVLLEQAWVREPKTTIENLIKEHISKLQENITVRRFARFAIKE
ncbi:MAG: translation elongation factor Ts [Chloroflexi bacterium]|nr:MAG: translation elongation factor Ts [Chloroflexota bacterium]TMD54847.1 MAG: translation elongation factor Ts [Chloroflexota bacterium]